MLGCPLIVCVKCVCSRAVCCHRQHLAVGRSSQVSLRSVQRIALLFLVDDCVASEHSTSAEDWQRAYDWKLSMGKMRINQTAATARKQEEARKAAQETVTREFNEDEDYSNLSLNEIAERARGWR